MMLTRRAALALLGATALARPALAQTRTVLDSAKRRIVLPDKISKVFVAGPPASVLVYVLARELMAGWVREPSAAEKEFLSAPARDLPETGRLTGRGDTVSLERLVAAKPDLVLDFGSVSQTFVSLADRVQSQTGIPYVLIDGSFTATSTSVNLAGDILGKSVRGDQIAGYIQQTFAKVDGVLTRVEPAHRPRVYLARGPEGLETAGRGSLNSEIIERVGAFNVAEGLGGRGNIANASLEQIIAWNPNHIVTLDRTFFRDVKSKPGWDKVKAVQQDKVYLAPSLPWGWIDAPPSINRMIGLRWLLATFYPGQAGIDLRADTREFYDLFYGVKLSDAQIDRLLGAKTAP